MSSIRENNKIFLEENEIQDNTEYLPKMSERNQRYRTPIPEERMIWEFNDEGDREVTGSTREEALEEWNKQAVNEAAGKEALMNMSVSQRNKNAKTIQKKYRSHKLKNETRKEIKKKMKKRMKQSITLNEDYLEHISKSEHPHHFLIRDKLVSQKDYASLELITISMINGIPFKKVDKMSSKDPTDWVLQYNDGTILSTGERSLEYQYRRDTYPRGGNIRTKKISDFSKEEIDFYVKILLEEGGNINYQYPGSVIKIKDRDDYEKLKRREMGDWGAGNATYGRTIGLYGSEKMDKKKLYTPLHLVCKYISIESDINSRYKLGRVLVKYGGDGNKKDADGNTPLHHLSLSKVLFQTDVITYESRIPRWLTEWINNGLVIQEHANGLPIIPSSVKEANNKENIRKFEELGKYIIKAGGDITIKNNMGYTATDLCLYTGGWQNKKFGELILKEGEGYNTMAGMMVGLSREMNPDVAKKIKSYIRDETPYLRGGKTKSKKTKKVRKTKRRM